MPDAPVNPRPYRRRGSPPGKMRLVQVAACLGVSRERVRQLAVAGRLGPVERVHARLVYVSAAAVEAEIARRLRRAGVIADIHAIVESYRTGSAA